MARRHPVGSDAQDRPGWSNGAAEDETTDPMKRDGKELALSGTKVVVPFLATLFIKLPLLGLLIPTTVVYRVLSAPFRKTAKSVHAATVATVADIPAGVKPLAERPYDIVLIGATGFTGRLAALYLARTYGTGVKWAIAGRQRSKLEKLREELAAINAELKELPIIVADVTDSQQLPAITNECRVVLTTAGPFEVYGHSLVRSCALHGTSYCDITGEFSWLRKTIDQFDDVARHTGARIVHFCGCDCIPTDLLALEVAQALKAKTGEALARIDFYDEIKGGFSGGTVATMSKAMHTKPEQYRAQLDYDPLLKDREGKKSERKVTPLMSNAVRYSSQFKRWTGPFVMSVINVNCFRRSNALNGYGQAVKWNEAVVYPSIFAAVSAAADMVLFFCMVACKPLSFLLPKPGDGPSEAAMKRGFLKLTAFGTGEQGGAVKGTLYYPDDVGYSSTGRMLVEAGMALLTPEVSTAGGVFTPAACQGSVLLKRLVATGCWFRVE